MGERVNGINLKEKCMIDFLPVETNVVIVCLRNKLVRNSSVVDMVIDDVSFDHNLVAFSWPIEFSNLGSFEND